MTAPRRFGSSVLSLPLWLRAAVSIPVAFVALVLAHSLWVLAQEEDPRPAALALFLLGVVCLLAAPFVLSLWRSNPLWLRRRSEGDALQRRLAASLRAGTEPATELTARGASCLGCGRPVVLSASRLPTRCPDCHREASGV